MPVYEFTCRDCHKTFEIAKPMSESAVHPSCPSCGSANTERTWTSIYAKTSRKS